MFKSILNLKQKRVNMLSKNLRDAITFERVVEFAQNNLNILLPNGFSGRFFLAGGCFKTLLHGKPPNDLDLWPASDHDRIQLLQALSLQGYDLKF